MLPRLRVAAQTAWILCHQQVAPWRLMNLLERSKEDKSVAK